MTTSPCSSLEALAQRIRAANIPEFEISFNPLDCEDYPHYPVMRAEDVRLFLSLRADELDAAYAAERQARAALEQALRQEYWLNHGCDEFAALYGDDGEMQCCGSPHRPMDFKRLPFDELQGTVHSLRLARVGRALLHGAGEQP